MLLQKGPLGHVPNQNYNQASWFKRDGRLYLLMRSHYETKQRILKAACDADPLAIFSQTSRSHMCILSSFKSLNPQALQTKRTSPGPEMLTPLQNWRLVQINPLRPVNLLTPSQSTFPSTRYCATLGIYN